MFEIVGFGDGEAREVDLPAQKSSKDWKGRDFMKKIGFL